MFWWKLGILILDLYLYSIKIQTNIDQNEVKNLWKIIDFFWNNFWRKYFFRAGPSRFLPASVCEQFTHACYSHDVINLQVHSVCALTAKLEKFTWKQDEGNNNFGPLSSPFRLFSFWFPWFFLFFLFLFSVLLAVPSLSSLSSPSSRYSLFFSFPSPFLFLSSLSSASLRSSPVYLSFCSFQKISHPLFLSPYAAQFSFMFPSVSFYSPCSPPFSFFFFFCVSASPLSSSFSGFYKPKNALRCNVQHVEE